MFLLSNRKPEGELNTSSGLFYQKELMEFDNIDNFMNKYYQENTLLIPLASNMQAILGKDGYEDCGNIPQDLEIEYNIAEGVINENENLTEDQKDKELKELYRTTYDYRLLNPYVLKCKYLNPINIKMIGDKKHRGLIGDTCKCLSWIDKQFLKVPFAWAKKWVKILQNKYDNEMCTNKGNIIKTVIWIPLYSVSKTSCLRISLVDRIDIILT